MQPTQTAFCYSFNCTLLPIQFVIVRRVWHWHRQDMHWILRKRGIGYLTLCTLSKFVEIQMINRISKKVPPHTHALSPADLLDSTGATYDDACVVWGHSPVDIVVCIVHTGEHLSCSVCDYQCRRDCNLIIPSNDTCVVISCPIRIQEVSQLHTLVTFHNSIEPTWPHCYLRLSSCETSITVVILRKNRLLELGSLVTSHVYFSLSISEVPFDLAWLWKVRGRFTLVRSTLYLH